MALIKCSECKKEISNKAVTCPHCGAPVVIQVDWAKKAREKEIEERIERQKQLDEFELEQISKLPPTKRFAAERIRKERLENKEKNNRLKEWIILIVIIALIVGVIRSCQKTPDEIARDAARDREHASEIEQISKENAAEERIKAGMKNPDSYEHVGTSYGLDSVGRETVTIRYRGTNGFGGVVTEEQTVLVD